MIPRILIIAGSDSGGGAGIQADIKSVSALGGHAMTAITAVTAQNTLGVQAVHLIPSDIVIAQARACLDDLGADAIKIGMLGSAETAQAVADLLDGLDLPIVFDPVMVATSGAMLADAATVAAFERLLRLATVVTPNVPELERLWGASATSEAEGERAAVDVAETYGCAVLAKGGHRDPRDTAQVLDQASGTTTDDLLADCLALPNGETMVWTDPKIDTRHTHGTGCTLASAIAFGLAKGQTLPDAIQQARAFVRASLARAPGLGQGHGPMGQQFAIGYACPT